MIKGEKNRPHSFIRESIDESKIEFFQETLLRWYKKNGRSFLWREKQATNYQLIISEIFLQRTKAESVAKFLPAFFEKYPDWTSLGEASEVELQNFTKPLGLFKQRGASLYKLAQEIKQRNGEFPKERAKVEDLPMMGQYITNAFELYILKKRTPLLDVNMARILERFFGPRKLADIRQDPYLQTLAYRIVNHPKSKELNWAILDYCAIICQIKPKCNLCNIKASCLFYKKQND